MHNFSISTYSISGGAWVGEPLGGYGALFRHWGSCAATAGTPATASFVVILIKFSKTGSWQQGRLGTTLCSDKSC